MQSKVLVSGILALTLAGCVDTSLPVTKGRISTEDQFLATVAGKTISNSDTTISIKHNGTITGVTHGNEISGTWEWRDGFWCRTITEPAVTPEDCQVWEITQSQLVITREKGAGEVLRYALPRSVAPVE